jgi:putative FmdB family regulatory protein
MPTYEYQCKCCNHCFEAFQSMKDDPLSECPKCLVSALQRLISGGSGFALKGGGWYKDLYSSTSKSVDGSSGGGGIE